MRRIPQIRFRVCRFRFFTNPLVVFSVVIGMKPKLIAFIPVFVLIIVSGCDKTICTNSVAELEGTDTIYPNAYYPAYPGSWWEYDDGTREAVDLEWHNLTIDAGKSQLWKCSHTVQKQVVVPKIQNIYLHGDKSIYADGRLVDQLFSDEAEWVKWENDCPNAAGCEAVRTRVAVHPEYEVNGTTYSEVLEIREDSYVYQADISKYDSDVYFYANNIGLIRLIDHDYEGNADTMNLVDYHINF